MNDVSQYWILYWEWITPVGKDWLDVVNVVASLIIAVAAFFIAFRRYTSTVESHRYAKLKDIYDYKKELYDWIDDISLNYQKALKVYGKNNVNKSRQLRRVNRKKEYYIFAAKILISDKASVEIKEIIEFLQANKSNKKNNEVVYNRLFKGEDVSWEVARNKINDIIDREVGYHP